MSEEDRPDEQNSPWMGCFLYGLVALAVLFAPILIAFATTAPGANMFSEGDSNSGGSAIWLMFFSIPLSFFIFIAGIRHGVTKSRERKWQQKYGSTDFPDMM